jgi:phosphohistidine phosphatase SixA
MRESRRNWMRFPVSQVSLAFWLLILACAVCAQDERSSQPVNPLAGQALVDALRMGGFIIYFRHTATDFGQSDENMTSFEDCANQRNLTDQGRDEARRIGAAISQLKIPLGPILASPFCRTLETATLAFGRAEKTLDLKGGPATTDPQRYAGLRKLLAKTPPAGKNTILVGHGNPFRSVAGAPHLTQGEAAVVQARGDEAFEIRARIPLDGWDELLRMK